MPLIEAQKVYQHIDKAVTDQHFSPIYCFFGEEPYLIQQATQFLTASALDGAPADFNLSRYYAENTEIQHIKDEVETLPMMTARRVVLVKEVQDWKDSDWELMDSVLQNPVETTVLILTANRLDKRKKYFRVLQEKAELVEFKKPYENQIPGWIKQIAKVHQLGISEESVQLIHRLVGSHLLEIEVEIKKLKDYLGERTQVEVDDVNQVVSRQREESIFDFAETVAMGDRGQSLLMLTRLMDQGESPVGIVSLIARHIRILMLVKSGTELGLNGPKLAQHVQVPPYFLNDYLKQSKSWTMKKLESVLLNVAETERALKASPVSSHIWLENLVLKTCFTHQSAVQNSTL